MRGRLLLASVAAAAVFLVFLGMESSVPVVIIVTESTRADHVGPCYGYDRATAPNLCGVAEDGVLFEQAYSQSSWTYGAVPSLLTGGLPSAVGYHNYSHRQRRFSPPSMARVLEKEGYRVVTNNWTMRMRSELGFNETYSTAGDPGRLTDDTFLFWFIREYAHAPYAPPEETRLWDGLNLEREEIVNRTTRKEDGLRLPLNYRESNLTRQDYVDLYDAEIRAADREASRLVEHLKDEGIYRRSLLIVTSDHGELFGEGGQLFHGHMPRTPVVHVPLIVKLPGNALAGTRVEQPVMHLDIAPTVYDVLGVGVDFELEGRSLRKAPDSDWNRSIISSWTANRWRMVRTEDYLYYIEDPACVNDTEQVHEILYSLSGGEGQDPETDISPDNPELVAGFRAEVCRLYRKGESRRVSSRDSGLDEAARERLRELGYLEN